MRNSIDDDYHIYSMRADGSGLEQLTSARGVTDIDPFFLGLGSGSCPPPPGPAPVRRPAPGNEAPLGDMNCDADDPLLGRLLDRPDTVDPLGKVLGPDTPPRIDWIISRASLR